TPYIPPAAIITASNANAPIRNALKRSPAVELEKTSSMVDTLNTGWSEYEARIASFTLLTNLACAGNESPSTYALGRKYCRNEVYNCGSGPMFTPRVRVSPTHLTHPITPC